ncbi:MAG: hypothetical protein PHY12_05555 [Eubacteriales bacterium]|nr:hypothetical protein [Eubacteriales bacterium]
MNGMSIAALLCAACVLSHRSRRRIEETLPAAICLLLPLLLALGMLQKLAWIDWISCAAVAATLVWAAARLMRGRSSLRSLAAFLQTQIFTPGLLCVALSAAAFWLMTRGRFVQDNDELNYWATQVRSLWISGGLVDAAHSPCLDFSGYLPGMPLLEWLGMHVYGAWNESVLYFTLFFTSSLFLLPFMRRVEWKRAWWIPVYVLASVAWPTLFSGAPYAILSTDAVMGFLLGYALCALWRNESPLDLLGAGAALCALTLAKEIGLFWALMAVAFDALVMRRKGAWKLAVAPIALWLVWKLFCRANGLGVYLNARAGNELSALLTGTYQHPAGITLVFRAALKALLLNPFSQSGYQDGLKAALGLPPLVWGALFAFTPRLCGEKNRRFSLYVTATGLVWLALFLLSFWTVFAGEVYHYARVPEHVVQRMDRYSQPYFLSMGMLCAGLWAEKAGQRRRLTAALLACAVLLVNGPLLLDQLRYGETHPNPHLAENLREAAWYQALTDEQRADTHVMLISDVPERTWAYAYTPVTFIRPTEQALQSAEALRDWMKPWLITDVWVRGREWEDGTRDRFEALTGLILPDGEPVALSNLHLPFDSSARTKPGSCEVQGKRLTIAMRDDTEEGSR